MTDLPVVEDVPAPNAEIARLRWLWLSVIRVAIDDARGRNISYIHDKQDVIDSARAWPQSGAFRRVCWLAGLDPDWARPRVIAAMECDHSLSVRRCR